MVSNLHIGLEESVPHGKTYDQRTIQLQYPHLSFSEHQVQCLHGQTQGRRGNSNPVGQMVDSRPISGLQLVDGRLSSTNNTIHQRADGRLAAFEDQSQLPKQDRVRKPRMKNRPTHQDINGAGTRNAAIADELWDGDEGSGTTAGAAEHGPSTGYRTIPTGSTRSRTGPTGND
ncbi:hypothetical protein EYZ11_013198 [Aspergillus tanneri]|uniref:Uncharacterized protein n=1 Tax=Aspergillus tanneri TaxID=1220188 RepID=A0A4S3J0D7_9EURO|nr:hypothetical protein EYZ11_013198 [Aspergillus tanneri]